jgi:hypothetical protein
MFRPNCQRKGCTRVRPDFGLLLNRKKVPQFEGKDFCSENCLELQVESELSERWQNVHRSARPRVPRPKIGAILLQNGMITQHQLEEAIALQKREGHGRIGEWLQRLGIVSERQITQALSRQYALPMINLRETDPPSEAVHLIPGIIARSFSALPVGYDEDRATIQLAVIPPFGFLTQDILRKMTGKNLSIFVGDESKIRRLLELWYETCASGDKEGVFEDLPDVLSIGRATVAFACESRASNLQIELLEDYLWTRVDLQNSSLHRVCRQAAVVRRDSSQTSASASSSVNVA